MPQEAIKIWLRKRAAAEAAQSLAFATGCFMVGAVVVAVTFLVTYAVAWFVCNVAVSGFAELLLGQKVGLSPGVLLVASVLLVGLLFRGNAQRTREYLSRRPRREDAMPEGMARGSGLPALISLLAYPGASSKVITDVLYTGPRLVTMAWSHLGKAGRLLRLDWEGCARVLELLLARASRISFSELAERTRLANPLKVFLQLRDLDGVVFLATEPSGLSLTSELRSTLRDAVGPVRWEPAFVSEVERQASIVRSLYELLGIGPHASPHRVRSAYRRRLRECEPAHLAELGPELQRLAEEHTTAVHSAYEAFLAGHPRSKAGPAVPDVERVWEQHKPTN